MPQLAQTYFGGQPLIQREIAGLLLIENEYSPRLRIGAHYHDNVYLCLVCHGSFSEQSGGKIQLCGPSTVILHPAYEVHSDRFGDHGGHCFNIQFSSHWLRRWNIANDLLKRRLYYKGGALVQLAMKLYQESLRMDDVSCLVIEGLALEIVGEAARSDFNESPRWLKQAQDFIHANFSRTASLIVVAQEVSVDPTHLARVFRRNFGCTVGEYVRQLRVEFARRQLTMSADPLVQIAHSAGFADQSHFSKTFKRLTGFSPAELRKMSRPRQCQTKAPQSDKTHKPPAP